MVINPELLHRKSVKNLNSHAHTNVNLKYVIKRDNKSVGNQGIFLFFDQFQRYDITALGQLKYIKLNEFISLVISTHLQQKQIFTISRTAEYNLYSYASSYEFPYSHNKINNTYIN